MSSCVLSVRWTTRRWDVGVDSTVVSQLSLGIDTIIVSTGVDAIIVSTGVDTIIVLTGVTTSNWPTVTVGVDCSTGSSWLQGPVSDDSDSVSLGALCSSVALSRPGYKGLSMTTVTVCHLVLSAPL